MESLLKLNHSLHLGLTFLAFITLLWMGWKTNNLLKIFLFWWQRKRGKLGEIKAKKILKKYGYTIIETQRTIRGSMYIDDQPADFYIRPDYIVEKNNIQYIAEVKTGKSAFATNRTTRRQMYEYAALTGTKTIILVDSSRGTVMKVRFN